MNRIKIRFPIFSSCLLLFFIFAVPTVEGQSTGKKAASRLTQAKRKAASVTTAKTTDQKIWDNQPAKNWMTDAYPIGNGRIGGMIFGGVNSEHIQFNDNTLWTGNETERGTYQAFGDLFIDFDQTSDHPENYHRELDLSRSLSTISYSANQTQFKREYFCSFPDQVMVLRYTADKKGAISASLRLKDAHGAQPTANGTMVQLNGKLSNGMEYQATALLQLEGGSAKVQADPQGGSLLKISEANAMTILLSAATNFSMDRKQNWKTTESAAAKVQRLLKSAAAKGYTELLSRHIKDYQQLYGRVKLDLGQSNENTIRMPTAKRLLEYRKSPDPQLEGLIFQYGRYLLISSSRKGGLPANLQGLWNESNDPPWGSDYHTNINIQMNYWPAEPANLSECHFPYLDHINSIREVRKINTRKEYPGVRGWTLRTESNPFGGESYLWNTPGSAWYAQALWEHYAFTKDKTYLKEFAYPILKEITEFWDDHLKRRPDGTLVSPMGWSPEHGPTEDGVTHDQQIVDDLFTNYTEAAAILGIDADYRKHITDLKAHLLQPKIGKWGQLQEWETDRDDPKDTHRHVSHLFGLHPGRSISTIKTPELAKAARVSLMARGDESTGWSMAWKINFWARLQDGDHAHTIIHNFISLVGSGGVDYNEGGGIYANLFCAHPPFQIDGNFGYTAGVAEMLVQSHADEIQLLPALPKAWLTGKVQGLKARGNFEISDMSWSNGQLNSISIKSGSGGNCSLRYGNLKHTVVTQKGKTYRFELDKKGFRKAG